MSKKPTDGSHEPEVELRPDLAEYLGLAGDTNGIEPVLAQKTLDFEKKWLKVACRGPRMTGARQEAVRCRFAEDFDNNTIRYHQVLSWLSGSPATGAIEPVLVHRLRTTRDNQSV